MGRFENSPDLFGRGFGISTCGEFTCGICGTIWNKGNDETESYDGESVLNASFAGIAICGDCFEKVENEILRRMPDILEWYVRINKRQRKLAEAAEALLEYVSGRGLLKT